MTLQEFINKYNGQPIDFDKSYGNQCVDLMNQYLVDVCGVLSPISTFPGDTAFHIYENASDSRFDKIANTPEGIPQPGDIIFWNTSVGSAGHVAIFISGDTNNFTSFDQNWPQGSFCHEQGHDYNGVAGWLHFKVQDTQKVIDELRAARDLNWNNFQSELAKNTDLSNQIVELNKKVGELTNDSANLTAEVKTITDKCATLASTLADVHTQDSAAIDLGQKSQTDFKNLTLDFLTISTALNCNSDTKSILTAIDALEGQLRAKETDKNNQAKAYQGFLNLFIKLFVKKK